MALVLTSLRPSNRDALVVSIGVEFSMSLQTRTAAPGKARRAAKGKPRHTTAEKAARKAVVAKPAARGTAKRSAPVKDAASAAAKASTKPTTRYSDRESSSKKEVRLADRSKLRAQRFQERTASKSKNVEGAPKGNPKLAKSAHLKSQREHLSQLEIVQQRLSSQPENVQRLSHNHALQSSLQIAQNVQSALSVQSV